MLFSTKSENLKLASRSRDYMRKSTIENLKTCQPHEQNMQLSFDKRCSFPAQNSAFSFSGILRTGSFEVHSKMKGGGVVYLSKYATY